MLLDTRSHLAGEHATLSASNNAWTNYDLEKLETVYRAKLAAAHGTRQHEFAASCIRMGQLLPDTGQTLNTYVNDAVGYRMHAEQVLFYNMDAFGTADAISDRDKILRIHDLKTGLTETSFTQLYVYGAYYCLQYEVDPLDEKALTHIEFRIYQNDEIKILEADRTTIRQIMEHTRICAKRIAELRAEVE